MAPGGSTCGFPLHGVRRFPPKKDANKWVQLVVSFSSCFGLQLLVSLHTPRRMGSNSNGAGSPSLPRNDLEFFCVCLTEKFVGSCWFCLTNRGYPKMEMAIGLSLRVTFLGEKNTKRKPIFYALSFGGLSMIWRHANLVPTLLH